MIGCVCITIPKLLAPKKNPSGEMELIQTHSGNGRLESFLLVKFFFEAIIPIKIKQKTIRNSSGISDFWLMLKQVDVCDWHDNKVNELSQTSTKCVLFWNSIFGNLLLVRISFESLATTNKHPQKSTRFLFLT